MPLATVLVVEDDRNSATLIAQTLRDEGYHVWMTAGRAAVDLALRIHPDLVLLDLMMPGMDGTEVCRCLRADPQTSAVPIVLMSAYHESAAPDVPVEAFLPKPFDLDRLDDLVAQYTRPAEALGS